MFYESGVLNAADKAALKDDVEKIRWLYTLKPSTINIAPYHDKEREYLEVAILQVEVASSNRIKRIAHFVNRAIPYPLVIFFVSGKSEVEAFATAVADKRINQADKEKWVVEDTLLTDWIKFSEQSVRSEQQEFMKSLSVTNLSFTDFWRFYHAIVDRVVSLYCSKYTGRYVQNNGVDSQSGDRLKTIKSIEKLITEKSELTNRLKKEKQIGRQVELNTKVKNILDQIAQLKSSLENSLNIE